MLIAQLENYGVPLNQWTTLENFCTFVSLVGDNNLRVSPQRIQFYFDSTDEVCFVRYTEGVPSRLDDISKLQPGYAVVRHDSLNYELKMRKGGVVDPTAGKYHTMISLDSIVGFYQLKK